MNAEKYVLIGCCYGFVESYWVIEMSKSREHVLRKRSRSSGGVSAEKFSAYTRIFRLHTT